jgi:hypothetical protein
MLREIKNDAVVHTLDVRDRGTAVIAFNIIGKIVSCQDVYFHLKQRKPMTGLWRILSRCGVRNWERNEICFQRRNEWRARQDLNLEYLTVYTCHLNSIFASVVDTNVFLFFRRIKNTTQKTMRNAVGILMSTIIVRPDIPVQR